MRRALVLGVLVSLIGLTGCATRYYSEDELYTRAQDALSQDRVQRAQTPLQSIETYYPFGRYAQQAQLELIYVHLRQGETEEALIRAERFIRLQPSHPHLDYAYFLRALASYQLATTGRGIFDQAERRNTQNLERSWRHFQALQQQFPDSPFQPDARTYMADLRQLLAKHDLSVASLYYRQGAYVASLARASNVLDSYPGSIHTLEALELIINNYRQLGQTQEAELYQQRKQQWQAQVAANSAS